MFYVLKRSADLIRKKPSRLLQLFSGAGWRSVAAILAEASAIRRKRRASPDERKRISHERRMGHFQSETWRHEGNVSQRVYGTYEEYLAHQKSKLSRERVFANLTKRFDERVATFRRHLELIVELKPASNVLCLAARLGHEVKAFISLGHFAVGVDLNPGESNPYVVTGDFHALVFGDDTVDCVYTNSLDHAFDIEKISKEVSRVLKHGGHFIVELFPGYKEGFVAGDYEAMHWADSRQFAEKIRSAGGFENVAMRDLSPVGLERGLQCVMRKS